MASAKDVRLAPITPQMSRKLIARLHYSGKSVNNAQMHIGAYLGKNLEGAIQIGPPMDRRKLMGLVDGSRWNSFFEINRMAFSSALPRNSESRALAYVARKIKKRRPDIEYLISYSDAAQCGDGTIYRASGFLLTQIKRNETIYVFPDGQKMADISMRPGTQCRIQLMKRYKVLDVGQSDRSILAACGARRIPGFQLRYILCLQPGVRERLTCEILPYSSIEKCGAKMYRGKRATSIGADAPAHQAGEGCSQQTVALQSKTPAMVGHNA